MNKLKHFIAFLTLIVCFSCNNEVTQKLEPKSSALGRMNEIVVIADEDVWNGAIGDTFRFYFNSAYPILPAPEPVFDLRHFTIQQLDGQPLRKELRTYAILADLSDIESPTTLMVKKDLGSEKFNSAVRTGSPSTSVGKEKWARGQLLVYLFGQNKKALFENIKNSFPAVAKRVNGHDSKQLESSLYFDKINMGITRKVTERFGVEIMIPGGFVVSTDDKENNLMWLQKETDDAILNIVFKKSDYNNENQLSKNSIIAMRDDFGKKYVDPLTEGNFMVTNTSDLPVYEYNFKLDGQYAKEFRGVWELTQQFSGGPFITYVALSPDQKSFIYIDAFITAPGAKKRDKMMRMDYMVKSTKFVSQEVN